MRDTVIVIPCYNEAERLAVERLRAYVQSEPSVRLLFVDDGSQDATRERLASFVAEIGDAGQLLALPENCGKGEAVRRGLLQAFAEEPRYAGYWDADLSAPLEAVADLRAVLEADPRIELVLGARVKLLGWAIERRALRHYLGRVFATVASQMLGLAVYDTQCGAKLLRVTERTRELFADPFLSRWVFDVELLARWIEGARAGALPPPEEALREHPLREWRHVPGSKIRPRDAWNVAADLVRIYARYLREETEAGQRAHGQELASRSSSRRIASERAARKDPRDEGDRA